MSNNSQGGMQVVKVLDRLASDASAKLYVYNPLTWQKENRYEIANPVTGQILPVVGLKLPSVSAVGAGGLTRVLPNQWEINFKLKTIPDTVEELTGFCKEKDWWN